MSWKFYMKELSRKTSVICNSFDQRKASVIFIRAKKMSTYTVVFPQQEKTQSIMNITSKDFKGVCKT